MKRKILFATLVACAGLFFSSCQDEEEFKISDDTMLGSEKSDYEVYANSSFSSSCDALNQFAQLLSKVISERKDVREFLKEEALKCFDTNYDVLYYLASDKLIGEETFRDILVSYSSEEFISDLEKTVPLLNIYSTKVGFLNVFPEDMDVDDTEIPVAVRIVDSTYLYVNGIKESVLGPNEVPGFNVFVVGVNRMVEIDDSDGLSKCGGKKIRFKSPTFDGSRKKLSKASPVSSKFLGTRAIDSYIYFNSDAGVSNKCLQRDYIYYGITPTNTIGDSHSVSEYITYIRVEPKAMGFLSSEYDGDPCIKENSYENKGGTLSKEEQIAKLWTEGQYIFVFQVVKSGVLNAVETRIALTIDDMWDYSIREEKTQHKTWFRHSKYKYTISLDDFVAKDIYLGDDYDLGKWDIASEALTRRFIVFEEDEGKDIVRTETYEMSKAKDINFKDENKITLGLASSSEGASKPGAGNSNTGTVTVSIDSKTSVKVTTSVSTTIKEGSDNICKFDMYYYDPIIEGKDGTKYKMKTYGTNYFKFGITAK